MKTVQKTVRDAKCAGEKSETEAELWRSLEATESANVGRASTGDKPTATSTSSRTLYANQRPEE